MVANDMIADRLIRQITPKGGTFVDVGAHFGAVFSEVRRMDPSVTIIAVEADPDKHRLLRAWFGDCVIHGVAVGEAEGEAQFFVRPHATGYNTLVPDREGAGTVITVQVATLDSLLAETRIDVMKMDVEGAELGALRGAAHTIERDMPTVMFESVGRGENALGYFPEQIWEWFASRGYGIFTPDRVAHDAPPLGSEAFSDSHAYPFRTHNYFAIHASRRTAVRDRAREILGVKI